MRIFVGFDQREAVAYHVFCQSVIQSTTEPVEFCPLALNALKKLYQETHTDGSNAFIYSRFLIPHLCDHKGWALFVDGDMVCREDISELWKLRDPYKAVQVIQHDYKTKQKTKYLGSKNEDYPRKNWSSVILWNCGHYKNRVLTPEFIQKQTGAYLHRFSWLDDKYIGELPKEWNWLAIEYPANESAKLVHYTLGTPCFAEYKDCEHSDSWHANLSSALQPLDQPKGV